MNIDALTEIAEWLEAGAPHKGDLTGFDMTTYGLHNSCGTVACIAGAAVDFHRADLFQRALGSWSEAPIAVPPVAREILGLTYNQSEVLFCPCDDTDEDYPDDRGDLCEVYFEDDEDQDWIRHGDIDAAWAARTIRHLIATGRVNWRVTAPRPVFEEFL